MILILSRMTLLKRGWRFQNSPEGNRRDFVMRFFKKTSQIYFWGCYSNYLMADTVVVAVVNEAETAAAAVVETGTVVVVVEVVEVSVVTSWLLESPAMMANHSDFKKKEKHKLQIIKIWRKFLGLLRDSFIYDCSHLT